MKHNWWYKTSPSNPLGQFAKKKYYFSFAYSDTHMPSWLPEFSPTDSHFTVLRALCESENTQISPCNSFLDHQKS